MTTVSTTMALEFKNFAYPWPIAAIGGTLRFFLLAHNIDFHEISVDYAKWPEEKKRMIDSGENPCATLPVVNPNGPKPLIQHIATMRYLAREHGITTGNLQADYVQDLIADEYHTWRGRWKVAAFAEDPAIKSMYVEDELPKTLAMFEALYEKYKIDKNSPYMSVSVTGAGLWGDTAVFTLLFDHIQCKLLKPETLEPYRNLHELYNEFGKQPAVETWIQKLRTQFA